MKTKLGVEAVIFSEKNGEKFFLVLHRILNWTGWEFVKGGIEKGENLEESVLREIKEETGLKKVEILSRLPEKKEWTANNMKYSYDVFLVKADMAEKVFLNQEIREHDDFKWLPAKKVLTLLTHDNSKKVLELALRKLK